MDPKYFESLYPNTSRFKEIEEILSFVKNGNSCQLISFPGTGRSNILQLLAYNRGVREKHLGEKQKYVHFVYMNFSEVRNRTLHDVNKFIFLSLIDSLTEREFLEEHKKLNRIFKEYSKTNDELIFFQGLKEALNYLSIEKKLTIVLLFDRFEEYLPVLTDEFFANLRILRNKAKYRFSAVFTLNRPLEDLLKPTLFNQFYEFLAGHLVYVSLYDKPGMDFRISYFEKKYQRSLDKKTLTIIFSLTAGHGKLTRIALETVFEQNIKTLTKEEILQLLLAKKTITRALFEIYSFLSKEEIERLNKKSNDSFLENIGLFKDNKITILLFEKYLELKKTFISTEDEKDKIFIDHETNEIKKGKENLSDKLTSSEFKLLKYLLQNPERVIERNEIIEAVWQNTASFAGVSDQAVDQLVLRIRKKIEDNPNNPNYLLTIKGRGFKFIL
ncbi:MAG: winged helix-turn-helix domain-containing protein [Candidatus Levyibacteriota bacterium]